MSDTNALLLQILARLDKIEKSIAEGGGGSEGGSASNEPVLPKSIRAFDSYCLEFLDPFVSAANKLGGDAGASGNVIKEAWGELRKFLIVSTVCKEPDAANLQKLLAGMIEKITALKKLNQRNDWERHTKALCEGISILNWVVVKPAPCDYMESFVGGSDMYANKIRMEQKPTGPKPNPDGIAFCDTFKALLNNLIAYVKENHTTGTAWNKKPDAIPVDQYDPSKTAAAPAAKTGGATAAQAPSTAAVAAPKPVEAPKVNLFAALNKEGDITKGLKTVTKDMQTWRADYKPDESKPAPVTKKAVAPRAVETVKGPPKKEFNEAAKKWNVECMSASDGQVAVEISNFGETVYIFGCIGANILIKGKCKSIVVDGCKKTTVTFDEVMASCELVNCARMKLYCTSKIHAIAIDKTDGCEVYLPKTSLDTEILASKSSEMNVSFPDENGDMIERPIPEQYVHKITKDLKVSANVSDLYSH